MVVILMINSNVPYQLFSMDDVMEAGEYDWRVRLITSNLRVYLQSESISCQSDGLRISQVDHKENKLIRWDKGKVDYMCNIQEDLGFV